MLSFDPGHAHTPDQKVSLIKQSISLYYQYCIDPNQPSRIDPNCRDIQLVSEVSERISGNDNDQLQ
jgi:hypothetical protein